MDKGLPPRAFVLEEGEYERTMRRERQGAFWLGMWIGAASLFAVVGVLKLVSHCVA